MRDCFDRFFSYHHRMNLKGMLFVGLLALFGSAAGMSEIVAGKAVRIAIIGIPAEDKAKIDADYPVSEEGTINLPFVGKINVTGKTPEQISRDLEKAYVDAQIYMEPTVSVTPGLIQDPVSEVIHIGGQVGRPGPIDFAEGMTLWKAIEAAGGATEFGSLKRVKLYRDGKQTIHDMTNKDHLSIPLNANDTIEVPEKSSGCR